MHGQHLCERLTNVWLMLICYVDEDWAFIVTHGGGMMYEASFTFV